MARANNLDELLDFESRWDESLAAVLATLGLPVHTAFQATKLEPPCIEAIFIFLGEAPASDNATPQQRAVLAGGHTFTPVSFRGRVQVGLHLHRGQQTRAQVSAWRGGVRRLFLPHVQAFNGVVLPYYDLRSLTISEGERLTDEGRDLDVVQFRYEFVWAIHTDAWPS